MRCYFRSIEEMVDYFGANCWVITWPAERRKHDNANTEPDER